MRLNPLNQVLVSYGKPLKTIYGGYYHGLNPLNQVLVSYAETLQKQSQEEEGLNPLNQVLVSYAFSAWKNRERYYEVLIP